MSWTFDLVNGDYNLNAVRLLCMDTNAATPIFQDEEIQIFLQLKSSQGIYQSGQANPTGRPIPAPVQVYSIYSAAALALYAMAANKAYLSSISRILDVELDPSRAQKALKALADSYMELEDNSGAFAIAEMVNTPWDYQERTVKQFRRLFGGY